MVAHTPVSSSHFPTHQEPEQRALSAFRVKIACDLCAVAILLGLIALYAGSLLFL